MLHPLRPLEPRLTSLARARSLYQPDTHELHFLDIARGEVHHYSCVSRAHEVDVYDAHVSCIRLRQDQPGVRPFRSLSVSSPARSPLTLFLVKLPSQFIAVADRGFAFLPSRAPGSSHDSPAAVHYHVELEPDQHPHTKMFNDGEIDTLGRFMAGTKPGRGEPMGKREEVMWRLDGEGKLDKVMDGLALPNGISFSVDKTKMCVRVLLVPSLRSR